MSEPISGYFDNPVTDRREQYEGGRIVGAVPRSTIAAPEVARSAGITFPLDEWGTFPAPPEREA